MQKIDLIPSWPMQAFLSSFTARPQRHRRKWSLNQTCRRCRLTPWRPWSWPSQWAPQGGPCENSFENPWNFLLHPPWKSNYHHFIHNWTKAYSVNFHKLKKRLLPMVPWSPSIIICTIFFLFHLLEGSMTKQNVRTFTTILGQYFGIECKSFSLTMSRLSPTCQSSVHLWMVW